MQTALDDVSLNLRDNEFVAILGPSGSGKTTLLNVIGGLDRYDSGDLIINGISTKKYKDRDWDSYRNHTIGFVFQSYNLIPHQTILSNVELALTISGISRSERKKRAAEALKKVGLGDQLHKKPNQMSGGQMQRVAIARALINNPDILLADEPTGALDTETSVQVMELLKEVAKDKLVVMVTHNPELAEEYANRIVKLKDGKITNDSNPYVIKKSSLNETKHKNMGKASMSFLTSLSLSFNNLRTKKGRTLLTSFAGSMGIIGIALILSLSTGVNNYINAIQKDTMTSYPITIDAETIDMSSIMSANTAVATNDKTNHKLDAVYPNNKLIEMASNVTTNITKNNLTDFKKYLDNSKSNIHQYVGENGIIYSYDTKFGVYTKDDNGTFVNTDGSTLPESKSPSPLTMNNMRKMMSGETTNDNFQQLLPGSNGKSISKALTDKYDLLYGKWPQSYNEVILVLDKNNEVSAKALYDLGYLPTKDYREIIKNIDDGKEIKIEGKSISYKDMCSKDFYMIPACDTYVKNEKGIYASVADDTVKMENLMKSAVKLKVTGIVRPNTDDDNTLISSTIGYTKELTDYIIDYTNKSDVVKAQKESKNVNVLNGMTFSPSNDKGKIADAKKYLESLGISEKAKLCKEIMQNIYADKPEMLSQIMNKSEEELAASLDGYLKNPQDDVLLSIYDNYISSGTYDDNMNTLGVISLDAPSSISIYTDSFDAKDGVSQCISEYNSSAKEEDKINYTDYVGLLMSSVTTIINVISYVLIAFVSVSLIVSSIMIGIITYISVLERTKEIGILRAIGASKHNISRVFNAETLIIGLCSGIIGIGITLLLHIPINSLIHALTGSVDVNASLPFANAITLILLSMLLTLIGGIIPSKKAAKKDPVKALRSE